jgi:hypothetical protein
MPVIGERQAEPKKNRIHMQMITTGRPALRGTRVGGREATATMKRAIVTYLAAGRGGGGGRGGEEGVEDKGKWGREGRRGKL